ncbi:leucyl aminopeptidase [Candidatus Schneideria nysicola]|uniref:leucyl aminopeptidase n=1 Tax=Candidatus Schneideria nysicola TaxID=1081631 RepID=UPI001CAA5F23|nr:leucyl aminopeptidase [Candidatus Schneideria nysicola]UAJ65307.1 leucyl aminopeptidase [Candidatus Schneideria nysicola]
MKFDIIEEDINNKEEYHCIVLGVFESYILSSFAEKIDRISKGYLNILYHTNKFEGKIGQSLLLSHIPHLQQYKHILLIGCGNEQELDEYYFQQIIEKTALILREIRDEKILFSLTQLHLIGKDIYWKISQSIHIIETSIYSFNFFKKDRVVYNNFLKKISFIVDKESNISSCQRAVKHGVALTSGIKVAKDIANMPPNICTPLYLSEKLIQLSQKYDNTTASLINHRMMKEMGMNAYWAVGQGAENPPIMSIIQYDGNTYTKTNPIVLIGKGVTFDSGGLSIKPSYRLDEMKFDMCGAAAVYGTIYAAIQLALPLKIIGVLACCENLIHSRSFRPGDILTTLSGKTVEVLNTDAEGRLILCDVLTYVERFNPDVVIDVATLTGACEIALGNYFTGLISNQILLSKELVTASKQANDPVWCLPLEKNACKKQLESNFADISNDGGRAGGTITAGYFLSLFANKYHWAHLDIAGTAWKKGSDKGATGRPIAMLLQFLMNRSHGPQ